MRERVTGLRLIKHNGRNALLLASGRAAKEFGSCLNFPLLRIVEFLFGEIKRHALTRPTGQRAGTRARAGGPLSSFVRGLSRPPLPPRPGIS